MPPRRGRRGRRPAQRTSIPPPITTTSSNPYPTPGPSPNTEMAPNPTQVLDDNLRGTIQDLFSIQSNIHGYQGPATQRALVQNFTSLHGNLERIYSSAAPLASRPIPPEVIGYIEEGRNPDIYTREFVELTQKSNRYLRSKATAYAQFRDVLAQQMTEAWPEMKGAVDRVLDGQGAAVDGLEGLHEGGNSTKNVEQGQTDTQQTEPASDNAHAQSPASGEGQQRSKPFTLPGLGMVGSDS